MHMTESALPEQAANAIAIVPGVARATRSSMRRRCSSGASGATLIYLIGEDRSAQTLHGFVSGRRAGAARSSSTRRWRS